MNLVCSSRKPGNLAPTTKIDVRFDPLASLKYEIEVSHENISSKPAGPIGAIANRGASGKSCHLSVPGSQPNAIR